MNILEILNTEVQNKIYRGNFNNKDATFNKMVKSKREGGNFIDSGNFSYVKKDKDPHMVVKTSRTPDDAEQDGYWLFIDHVISNNLWENPYFPRVYVKKNIRDSGYDFMKRITMEKLETINSISEKEFSHILRYTFNADVDEVIPTSGQLSQVMVSHIMGQDMEDYNPNYIAAIKELSYLLKKHKLLLDLHSDNLMVRRGSFGVHLVITDPFSFKG